MTKALPEPTWKISDALAKRVIWVFSGIVFAAVAVLERVHIDPPAGFDVHLLAKANALINSTVAVLLLVGLVTVKLGRWQAHRKTMIAAIALSALFLVSYILHHLFAGDTRYGGQGALKALYFVVLITHILLAAGSLPFILTTAYRGLSGKYAHHRRIAKWTWPVWFYVSVSGVIVYLMISPYYQAS
jgi:putative membrane protein